MTTLIILNLSAAFGVIDYPILLKRLEFSLTWEKSYLAERTQCVTMANITSSSVGLPIGVPQGSVL